MPEFTKLFGITHEEIIKKFKEKTFYGGVFIIVLALPGTTFDSLNS